ncbi:hypothetical protein [Streptomyces sp. MP131-18]|uniref:hypothetical protein n=1 Tax=Streptomyces sp. MP131-18 TaxID=1857892 RepID=UPI00097C42FF|nr:hypothetical protein [Streptomyces sp. MP131-18]ONK11414.1 hypothetical protein STBA_21460 [Streptomyces sp. MP131-18]
MTEHASAGKRPTGLRHWLLRGLTTLGVMATGYAPRAWWDAPGDAWWERGDIEQLPPAQAAPPGPAEPTAPAPDPRHAFIPVWHPER